MAKRIYRGVGGLNIGVIGAQELINAFKSLGENAVMSLTEPSVAAANVVLKKAQALVPENTGELKNKLKVYKPTKSNKKAYKIQARVSFPRSVAYGVPLELGHKTANGSWYVMPRPFLRPAADNSKAEVAAILAKAMSDIIEEAGK